MRVSIRRMGDDEKITVQESAGITIITLRRPRSRNALTAAMWRELTHIGKNIIKNPKTKVVLLRGTQNQFTVGSDIKEFSRMTIDEANESFRLMEETMTTFEQLPIPAVALINGYALGAGMILALAMDLRIGTPTTEMGIPVGRLGIKINQSFTRRMVGLIGPSRTKDLIFTGRLLKADECYQLGLINYLLTDEQNGDHFALSIAQQISRQSSVALHAAKRNVAYTQTSLSVPWGKGTSSFVDPCDFPEGVRAFIEKRDPYFGQRRRCHVPTGRN